ncbi:MAG: hypothetical protein JO130_10260 [Solirubrobacterales bacterium]|nr:hypothetical protein [Solirubrobacterales bacterium]
MARKRMAWLVVLGCLLGAGCGTAATRSTTIRSTRAPSPAASGTPPAFAWLRPEPPPPGWTVARLRAGATLAVPPGWRRIRADVGTASAARVDPASGLIAEYLNSTPQQGDETLQNWSRFRPDHNLDEGDRHEQVLAAAQGLRFRSGSGSCVIDRYRTSRAGYQEIACLVRGARGESVIVAAALTAHWAQAAAVLERAVSAFVP